MASLSLRSRRREVGCLGGEGQGGEGRSRGMSGRGRGLEGVSGGLGENLGGIARDLGETVRTLGIYGGSKAMIKGDRDAWKSL